MVHEDVVIVVTSRDAMALDVKNGKRLWKKRGGFGTFRGKPDIFFAGGCLWLGLENRNGLDIRTGEIIRRKDLSGLFTHGHHARCYRAKATENYIMWSERGVEFMDLHGEKHMKHDWVRSTCRYGWMPANGLLYSAPTPCFCYPGVKKNGFNALTAVDRAISEDRHRDPGIEKGPAYEKINLHLAVGQETPAESGEWPTYRSDNARSGRSRTEVPVKLKEAWHVQFRGELTPPIVKYRSLIVSEKQTHTVHCLDAETGKKIWSYTAGGAVDSPPTVYKNRVIFGCKDGRVYCLNVIDGQLAWLFRGSPYEKKIVSFGQLQSAWPVHGSVLVENDIVYFAAGISSFLDGGLYLYGLDVVTGKIIHSERFDTTGFSLQEASKRSRAHDMDGGKNDIMVSNGSKIFLTQNVYDMNLNKLETKRIGRYGALETDLHLVASGGFLDDTGFDRLYWMHARRWPGFYLADRTSKAGQILVFDERRTYGLHKFNRKFSRSPYFAPGTQGCELFSDDNDNEPLLDKANEARERGSMSRVKDPVWSVQVPVVARAMVLAGDVLFFAGPPDVVNPADPLAAMEERAGGRLWAVSAADGKKLVEYELDSPPVWDGMAAANGRLYMSLTDGSIVCFGSNIRRR